MRGKMKKEAKIGLLFVLISISFLFMFYNNLIIAVEVPSNATLEPIAPLWIRDGSVYTFAYSYSNDLTYFGGDHGIFGAYNRTSNSTENLNKTDTGDWISSTLIRSLAYDSNDKLIYLAGSAGIFGVYNRTSNSSEDLRTTDTGDWIEGSTNIYDMAYDSDNNLIYLSGDGGVFGVYNKTSNTTEDLRGTDAGDWIGINTIYGLAYSLNDKLIYLAGTNGVFGVYNRTSNTTVVVAGLGEGTTGSSSPKGSSGPPTTETAIIPSIIPEEPAIIEIKNHYMSARKITINVNNPASDVSLTVKQMSTSSANFEVGFQGLSYEAFEITAVNLSNDNIKNATIEFRVNKTKLLESNFTTDDVFLYRKPVNTSDWAALNTTYLYDEDGYARFSAVSPGFSTFMVFVSPTECIPAEKRCLENQVQFCLGNKKWLVSEVCSYQCKDGKCIEKGLQINLNPLVVYPVIGIVVVGVLISFFAQRMVRRKKEYLSSSNINRKFGVE